MEEYVEDYFTYNYFTNLNDDIPTNLSSLDYIRDMMSEYSNNYPSTLFTTKVLLYKVKDETKIYRTTLFYTMNGYIFSYLDKYLSIVKSYNIVDFLKNEPFHYDLPVNITEIKFLDLVTTIKSEQILKIEYKKYSFKSVDKECSVFVQNGKILNKSFLGEYIESYKIVDFTSHEPLQIQLPVNVTYDSFIKAVQLIQNDRALQIEITYYNKIKDCVYFDKILFEDHDPDYRDRYVDYFNECNTCESTTNLYKATINVSPLVKRTLCLNCIRENNYIICDCSGNKKCLDICDCGCMEMDGYTEEYYYLPSENRCICGHENCHGYCNLCRYKCDFYFDIDK